MVVGAFPKLLTCDTGETVFCILSEVFLRCQHSDWYGEVLVLGCLFWQRFVYSFRDCGGAGGGGVMYYTRKIDVTPVTQTR